MDPRVQAAPRAEQPHSRSSELWDVRTGTGLFQVLVRALGNGRGEIFLPEQLAQSEAFCTLSLMSEHVS